MERSISATDANREFSRLLGEVAEGESFIVTTRGKPVMRLTPVVAEPQAKSDDRRRRLLGLLDRMAAQGLRHAGSVTRDDGYA